MIEVKNLTFEYPGTLALDNISFDIKQGEISALVGPNGAGKTTLLRCLAALDAPITGTIRIGEVDVLDHPRQAHRQVGYLADFFGLYNQLTVRQGLLYMARAHGLSKQEENSVVQKAALRLKLQDRLEQKINTLSRGLSQRLAIAQSIVHEPKVLLLDEPASGLDPEARKALSDLFLELKSQGMTLLISSHILAELEEYSTSMIIVRNGKILEHKKVGQQNDVQTFLSLETAYFVADLEQHLKDQGITEIKSHMTKTTFKYTKDKTAQHELLKNLMQKDFPICTFKEEKLNLQDAYLKQVEQVKEHNNENQS